MEVGATVRCVDWNPRDHTLTSSGDDGKVRFWADDGGLTQSVDTGGEKVRAIAWNPDGKRLAIGVDTELRLWQEEEPLDSWEGHNGSILGMAWSPDGRQLASCDSHSRTLLWNADGERRKVLGGKAWAIQSVAWSPDGQRIANACWEETVQVWGTDGEHQTDLRGHTCEVSSVDWHSERDLIVSGSRDATVRVWSPDGEARHVLHGHTDNIESVAWSPDGKSIASGSLDCTVRLWDADTGVARWSALLLGDGRSYTFATNGSILDGELSDADHHLTYIVEKADGGLDILTPSEFKARVAAAVSSDEIPSVEPGQSRHLTATASKRDAAERAAIEWALSVGGRVYSGAWGVLGGGEVNEISSPEEFEGGPISVLLDKTTRHHRIDDSSLTHLKGLTTICVLNLTEAHVTDAGLNQLVEFRGLTYLVLWNAQITDEGLAILKQLPELRFLILKDTGIGDSGLAHLAAMTQLEHLQLSGTHITDTGLQHLVRLPNLSVLYLGNTAISDDAVETLARMSSLRHLKIENTSITADGVARLRAALPNCRIDYAFD
jgi:dipeptidyl aminopeptidase/acylaminoacyl peptidase